MTNFPKSYSFGKSQERKILPILQDFFKRDIQPFKERYSKFDYFDDEYNYEVKSRTFRFDTYPDTMITCNKLIDSSKKLILIFNFTDIITYIEYDPQVFSLFRKKMFARSQNVLDEKEHIFIPINQLKKLSIS